MYAVNNILKKQVENLCEMESSRRDDLELYQSREGLIPNRNYLLGMRHFH
jgi:hypothetical protein